MLRLRVPQPNSFGHSFCCSQASQRYRDSAAMKFATAAAPHSVAPNSVRRVMLLVLGALLPATIAYVVWFGWGLVINIALAAVSALVAEALMLKLRNKPVTQFVTDSSAALTATLLAFALPPL